MPKDQALETAVQSAVEAMAALPGSADARTVAEAAVKAALASLEAQKYALVDTSLYPSERKPEWDPKNWN